MGKAKKGKKAGLEDEGDDEVETESAPIEDNAGRKNKAKGKSSKIQAEEDEENESGKTKGKKQKKAKKVDDDVDDIVKGVDEMAVDKTKKKGGKKAKAKKSKGAESGSDEDENAEEEKPAKKKGAGKGGKKMGFSILAAESEEESDKEKKSESEEEEEVVVVKKTKKSKPKPKPAFDVLGVEDDDATVGGNESSEGESKEKVEGSEDKSEHEKQRTSKEEKGGKKGKKKKRKNDDDEDELDKVLAELAMEYSGKKKDEPEPVIEKREAEASKDDEPKQEKEDVKEESKDDKKREDDEADEEGSTVKTAAQKKKEKKEKEKLKKLAQKKQETTKKGSGAPSEQKEVVVEEPKKAEDDKLKTQESVEDGNEPSAEQENEGEEDGKKKKKKKGAKEDDKKEKKGPGKKTIAAMQEALQKLREEEERMQREEEEKIKKLEEADKMKEEKLRLEQERKEKKKQKEKERKERLKAEGKLLTAKQKADKARAQALIDQLKAQGLEIGEKKPPRPGTRVRPGRGKQQQQQTDQEAQQVEVEIVDKNNVESARVGGTEGSVEQEKVEAVEVKDSWDAESSAEEEEDKSIDVKSEEKTEAKSEPENDQEEEEESESEESGSEEEESESESESEDEDHKTDAEKRRERAIARIQKRREEAEKTRTIENLRAAVVCVLGHVDTGKTKILDKLRRTNVQDAEAGGITQQIGATNVPIDAIKENTKMVKGFTDIELKLPGLLIIDTPGHESFSNLRSRGSSLCDIAILVVDIMHGLEPQTIESINLLKSRRTPFIVALNKIDRLYDWQTFPRKDIRDVIKGQASNTQLEFEKRTKEVVTQFAEQGLNAALSFENPDARSYVSLVPTSAFTGEGMGNLLALIVESCQNMLAKRLMYSEELQATVLEVKAIPGLGTTIDVILVNGTLRETETVVLAGTDGPIVTQIRSLLMPQPMKELRVKNAYTEYKEVKAAQGVKIAAKDLEKAIAGLNMLVAHQPDEVELCREEVSKELKKALSNIKLQERGVYVQASTLGSLEALLEFLKTSKIPYANIRIGPVVKRDVMKASTMLEHDGQYAAILAFDVKIERDAQELADSLGVKIFQADIIYHLFDKFMAYREELRQKKREEFKHIAVFPCKLKILPQFIFNSRDPIVMGVIVEAGVVKEGTPICVPSKEFLDIGIVTSIEINHKQHETARKGQEVCIKIEPIPGDSPKMFGRHFDETDILMSKISRQSIDACKDYFRDDLMKSDWQLMVELKKLFQIL